MLSRKTRRLRRSHGLFCATRWRQGVSRWTRRIPLSTKTWSKPTRCRCDQHWDQSFRRKRRTLRGVYSSQHCFEISRATALTREKVATVACHDPESLLQYYLEVQSNVRSLDALGFDTTSLGAPMIMVFLDKMPRDIQLMWTREKIGYKHNTFVHFSFSGWDDSRTDRSFERFDSRTERTAIWGNQSKQGKILGRRRCVRNGGNGAEGWRGDGRCGGNER